jgi:hypothetical protein
VIEVLLRRGPRMKYLLLLALVFVAYLLWRNARVRDARDGRPPPAQPPAATRRRW